MSAALWDSIVHNRPGLTVGNDLRPSSTDTSPPAFHSHLLTTTYTSHICIWDPAANLKFPHRQHVCVSSVCMPTCNVSCWGSHTPDTLLKMSHKFHGCVFYHWRMSACFSYQNGSEHLDDLIDLSFCCLLMLCLRNFVTLSLRHLPKCLCNLTQSWVLLAKSSTWQGQNRMMDLPCDDTCSHEDRWWGMTRCVKAKVWITTKNANVGTERFSLLFWQLPLWQDMASPTTTMCAIDV